MYYCIYYKMTSYAICIGINYSNTANALTKCIEDAYKMKNIAISKGYTVKMLVDEPGQLYPTKANILAQLDAIPDTTTKLFISYSGHGTQTIDTNGEENDYKDEVVVCLPPDNVFSAVRDYLVDDEIAQIFKMKFSNRDMDIFLFFDCCHSGTMSDLRYEYRQGAAAPVIADTGLTTNSSFLPRILSISASQDDQVASEVSTGGVFTTAFKTAVQSYPKLTIDNLLTVMNSSNITQYGQRPKLTVSTIVDVTTTDYLVTIATSALVLQQRVVTRCGDQGVCAIM